MPGVKTAISLEEDLFQQVSKLAQDLHISRSRLFTLAVKDYLRHQESKLLLAQLNEAYNDGPEPEEIAVSQAMRRKQRKSTAEE
ncbi:CopG family transcriptional regulator [bacterium]|nr:CopG family transcriptional regulator [bacterium]